jgi:hypothetical protein
VARIINEVTGGSSTRPRMFVSDLTQRARNEGKWSRLEKSGHNRAEIGLCEEDLATAGEEGNN